MFKIFFILSVVILSIFVVATSVLGGDVMKVETAAEQLYFVTLRIEIEKEDDEGNLSKEVGTGCIVKYKWKDDKFGNFLVTNKHVIQGAKKGKFFFTREKDKQPILGEIYNVELDNFEKLWYKHRDNRIDIAVMPLAPVQKAIKEKGWKIFYRSIGGDIILNDEKLKELDALESVIFIGYPSGMFDRKNYLPVIRNGITATPLNVDYEGLPQFLIDASVFPGSSGSPVFIYNRGSYSPRDGGLVAGNRLIFLGIISSVFIRKETGQIEFVEIPTQVVPIAKTPQMIDIGLVCKTSVVLDTIKQLLRQRGEIE